MKLSTLIQRIGELPLMVLARGILPLLPRRVILWLSRVLGAVAYALSPKLRRIAQANLDLAFGDSKTTEEKQAINRASFQSFTLVILDSFWLNRNTTSRLAKTMRYDASFRPVFDGPPVIIVTGHIGNWEIVSLGCGLEGHPMTSIAMPLKSPFADRELNRLREKTGSEIAARKGAIRHIIKALRNGRNTAVLVDQNTLPEEGGTFVPFFGLSVPVSKAAGALWARTKAKIMVCWCVPDEQGVYTVYARPPFTNDGETLTTEAIAARATQELEIIIRENPQFWLWSYKRWCFYRESDDKDRYPFYSKSYEDTLRRRALRQQ
jgi:KDO2-lipid IV(A) lauroyltransferase